MPWLRPMVGVLLEFVRALLERGEQLVGVGDQNVGGAFQLDAEAGVEHVGRRHALMHEAGVGADEFREVRQERDDVVLHLALDRVDLGDVEFCGAAFFPDRLGGGLRDDAEFGQRVGGVRLDLEPDAELRLRRPDRRHLGAGIAWDHATAFNDSSKIDKPSSSTLSSTVIGTSTRTPLP